MPPGRGPRAGAMFASRQRPHRLWPLDTPSKGCTRSGNVAENSFAGGGYQRQAACGGNGTGLAASNQAATAIAAESGGRRQFARSNGCVVEERFDILTISGRLDKVRPSWGSSSDWESARIALWRPGVRIPSSPPLASWAGLSPPFFVQPGGLSPLLLGARRVAPGICRPLAGPYAAAR